MNSLTNETLKDDYTNELYIDFVKWISENIMTQQFLDNY
jgi:hypothetical protein